jgi:hypothetical protein
MSEFFKSKQELSSTITELEQFELNVKDKIIQLRQSLNEIDDLGLYDFDQKTTYLDSTDLPQIVLYIGRIKSLASNFSNAKIIQRQSTIQIGNSQNYTNLSVTEPAWHINQVLPILIQAVQYLSIEEINLIESLSVACPLEILELALNITLDHDTSNTKEILTNVLNCNYVAPQGKVLRLVTANLSANKRFEKTLLSSSTVRDAMLESPFALQTLRRLSFGSCLYEILDFYQDFQLRTQGLANSALHITHHHDHFHLCLEQFYIFFRDRQDNLFNYILLEEISKQIIEKKIEINLLDFVLVGRYNLIDQQRARYLVEIISDVMEVNLY